MKWDSKFVCGLFGDCSDLDRISDLCSLVCDLCELGGVYLKYLRT